MWCTCLLLFNSIPVLFKFYVSRFVLCIVFVVCYGYFVLCDVIARYVMYGMCSVVLFVCVVFSVIMYVCVYVCMYVCVYVCMYVCYLMCCGVLVWVHIVIQCVVHSMFKCYGVLVCLGCVMLCYCVCIGYDCHIACSCVVC